MRVGTWAWLKNGRNRGNLVSIAFSSEVDTGSREENASNQKHRAPLLIPSEAERL
jgi:hypothetical protein